ncbi:MAG: hypothetical protein ABWJ98_06420 [Hydrogenothermaceae bacterium]
MRSIFFYLITILTTAFFSFGEEGLVVESRIVKQEVSREEINRLKLRLSEIEKNQKYILETLSQGHHSTKVDIPKDINQKLDLIIQNQKDLNLKVDDLEKQISKQLLLQNIMQYTIFAIFLVFMILLAKYKKEAMKIEGKIDNISNEIEENKRETIKFLLERVKDDPKLATALKNILEEYKQEK